MKKLIGIIAAMAMAASVFALNDATSMSASIRIGNDSWAQENSLFHYEKSGKLNAEGKTDDAVINSFMFHDDHGDGKTKIELSIDLGKVGANVKCGEGPGKIWFKPFDLDDLLKVSMGNVGGGDVLCGVAQKFAKSEDTSLNRWGAAGFQVETKPLDGLYLSAALYTGGSDIWWSDKGGYAANFLASYEDDTVGKIKAFWSLQQKGEVQKFGAGWTKTFGSITPIVNVIGYGNEWTETTYDKTKGIDTKDVAGLSKLVIEPTVKGDMDPLSWSVYIPVEFNFADMSENKATKAFLNDQSQAARDLYNENVPTFAQPKIGVDAKVAYKINDSGYLKSTWLNVGAPYVNAFNNVVGLQFEVGVNGDLSDNTHWSLTVDPTFVKVNHKACKVANADDPTKDALDSLFNIVIFPNLTGNYGGMEWNFGVKFTTGRTINVGDLVTGKTSTSGETKTIVDVPFTCKITF